jgi:hypothetical protein
MSALLEKIVSRVHARREKWHTFEVKELPLPQDFGDERVIVGGYTRCGLSSRLRFVRADVLMSVDGCNEPPSALAKDYLYIEYGQGPLNKDEQRKTINATISPQPLYSNPCEFEHGVYIDIKSCYWTVLHIIGWSVDYYPGKWIGAGMKPQSFPWPEHKIARHCLVSVAASDELPMWSPEREMYTQHIFNKIGNKGLYCLINDVLNAIAGEAIKMGAVYVHTDGYIAPGEKVARRIEQMIADWGLHATRKAQGRGFVTNTQAYRVGPMVSHAVVLDPTETRTVRDVPYRGWLQQRFAKAAAYREEQFEDILAESSSTGGARLEGDEDA